MAAAMLMWQLKRKRINLNFASVVRHVGNDVETSAHHARITRASGAGLVFTSRSAMTFKSYLMKTAWILPLRKVWAAD